MSFLFTRKVDRIQGHAPRDIEPLNPEANQAETLPKKKRKETTASQMRHY